MWEGRDIFCATQHKSGGLEISISRGLLVFQMRGGDSRKDFYIQGNKIDIDLCFWFSHSPLPPSQFFKDSVHLSLWDISQMDRMH
jgi:hypothetical protein